MKIVFWSESNSCKTTANMAAIGSMCSLLFPYQNILMQNRTGPGGLDFIFQPGKHIGFVQEESAYYALEGMDYLIWQEQNHRLDRDSMREGMVPVLDRKLFYLPSGKREKPRLYPKETGALQYEVIKKMEEFSDITFIDCGDLEDDLTEKLLKSADVVVVNLSQSKEALDSFFIKHHPICGKIIYLINNYDFNSVYNRKNLNRIYRISEEQLCVIPINQKFETACIAGKLDVFLKKQVNNRNSRQNKMFMKELLWSTHLILKAAGLAGA